MMTRAHAAAIGAGIGTLLAILQAAFGPGQPPISRLGVGFMTALFLGPGGAFLGLAVVVAVRNARDIPRLGTLWKAATVFFGAFALLEAAENYSTAEHFRLDGDSTEGTVIASHPYDHNTITVGFAAGGSAVQSQIPAPGSASDFEPGDRLKVYYDRTFPKRASAYWPRWYLISEVTAFLMPTVVLPIVGIALAGMWFRRRRGLGGTD